MYVNPSEHALENQASDLSRQKQQEYYIGKENVVLRNSDNFNSPMLERWSCSVRGLRRCAEGTPRSELSMAFSSAGGPGDHDAPGLVLIGLEFGLETLEFENC